MSRPLFNPTELQLAEAFLADAKAESLGTIGGLVTAHQRLGEFPTKRDEFEVFLKTGARRIKTGRTLQQLNTRFLKFPYQIDFVVAGAAGVFDALESVYNKAVAYAPVRTGHYRHGIQIFYNYRPVSWTRAKEIADGDLPVGARFQVIATAVHSSTLESNYTSRRGRGLMVKAARSVMGKHEAAVRLIYLSSDRFGISYPGGKIYSQPVIEIGAKGDFFDAISSSVGKNRKARARRARRGSR